VIDGARLPGESDQAWIERLQDAASRQAGGQHLYAPPTVADLPPKPAHEPIKRPKIHAADIPARVPPPDSGEFHKALHLAALQRTKGDPSYAMIVAVGRRIFYLMSTQKRRTQAEIGRDCDCSDESVRQVLLFLEPRRVLAALNVLVRVGRNLRRAANLYVGPWFVKASSQSRGGSFLAECGRLIDLCVRSIGLNTTPLRPADT
jgi:hypothetical protein